MKDLHTNIKVINAITPQAVGTTGSAGGKTSAFIDRRGYESVEFVCQSGASASVADTVTTQVTESDATGSGFATIDWYFARSRSISRLILSKRSR